MTVPDSHQHFRKHLAHSGGVLVIAQNHDFGATVHNSDRGDFLDPFPDFPVFAKELDGFFLAI